MGLPFSFSLLKINHLETVVNHSNCSIFLPDLEYREPKLFTLAPDKQKQNNKKNQQHTKQQQQQKLKRYYYP